MKKLIPAFLAFMVLPFIFAYLANAEQPPKMEKASFAMGCFWCAEHDFEKVKGVANVVSGYEGGEKDTATYDQVSQGNTGHFESVEVTYDPKKVTYSELLKTFWDNVDPFDGEGQFCDKGKQYAAIIFVDNKDERAAAQKSLDDLQARHTDKKVTVQILDAKPFYPAEAYHQNFAEQNAMHYKLYRAGCNRDDKLEELHKSE